jgi:hypothetical protein
VRFDRAVATPGWSELFPGARTNHMITSRSDHCPISLPVEVDSNNGPKQYIARYEFMWE